MSNESQMDITELMKQLGGDSGGVVSHDNAREAILIERDDLPWAELPDGSLLQLLQVDLSNNIWVIRSLFRPGFCIDTHYHTGPVYAFTESGEWYYKEYPHLVNKAGSYLFEPAHSIHTLTVADDAKEDAVASFVIHGSNVNIDEDGKVVSILDAQSVLKLYQILCKAQGLNSEGVIIKE